VTIATVLKNTVISAKRMVGWTDPLVQYAGGLNRTLSQAFSLITTNPMRDLLIITCGGVLMVYGDGSFVIGLAAHRLA
jgi:hypothetical protein